MGANSYEEYLRNFVETVKPDDHNMAYTAWPTVVFDSEGEVVEISREDGREHPLLDDSPELPGIQLSFGAGDARLFLLPIERK